MQRVLALVVLLFVGAAFSASLYPVSNPLNAPDVPGFTPNPITIPAGSLIIPMDTTNQVIVPGTGQMSMLPYGLVVRTLHANISVWWAIQTGKSLNGVDFVASTSATTFGQIVAGKNTATDPASFSGWTNKGATSYSGGPFIILKKDAQKAFAAWNSWAITPSSYYLTVDPSVYSTVQVHELNAATTMDIRHQIYTHPVIAVSNLDGNAPTQTAMLGCIYQNMSGRLCPREDGYGWGDIFGNGAPGCVAFQPVDHAGLDWNYHYKTYDCGYQVAALTSTTCLTTFSEPHWEWNAANGPSYITAMKAFIASGANFLAQCASTQSYENQAGTAGTGTFLSNYGLSPVNPSDGIDPPNTVTEYPDLPVVQYIGQMSSAITGAVPDFYNLFSASDNVPSGWTVQTGNGPHAGAYNNFQATAFPLVTDVYDSSGSFNGRNIYVAAGAKYAPLQFGANIWYLTGHTWVGQTAAGEENGRRFFFNAMLVPAERPAACGFTFCEASDVCAPQDSCHTCACAADGSGFVQTAITPCCLSNTDCTGECQECNTVTHQCQLIPGCCTASGSIACPACQTCQNNLCASTAGCCTQNSQCGNSPCLVCTGQQTCITTTGCCDLASAINPCSSQTCYVCDNTTNACARQQPLTSCCLANADCGNNPCKACNAQNHLCYDVPGCCNLNTDCGTDPCIVCTNNSCVVKADCCTLNTQCGGCQVCNSSNKCAPNPDPNCCTSDDQCGSCRRCAVGFNGTRTCVEISQCCLTGADCEACQNCTNSQCVPIEACCRFDTDCPGCEVCIDFDCFASPHLSCCSSDQECYTAATMNGNSTDCNWVCQFSNSNTTTTGVCQQVCSSGRDWTGLIAGLAAGVPAAILFFLALSALIAFLIYRYKDWLNNFIFANDVFNDSGSVTNPGYADAVQTGSNPTFT